MGFKRKILCRFTKNVYIQEYSHTKRIKRQKIFRISKILHRIFYTAYYILYNLFLFKDKYSMKAVLDAADKANGYCFGDSEEKHSLAKMMGLAIKDSKLEFVQSMQTKYCEKKENESQNNVKHSWFCV